jgi:hypothetical protein
LVAGSEIGCITSGWYHGGISMCESNAGHPIDPTSGLKGGFPGGSPSSELSLGQSLGYPSSDGC